MLAVNVHQMNQNYQHLLKQKQQKDHSKKCRVSKEGKHLLCFVNDIMKSKNQMVIPAEARAQVRKYTDEEMFCEALLH